MAVQKKSQKRIKKENYWERLQVTVQKYKNVMFVDANNVSSKQICMIRADLRKINAVMVMGKNVSNEVFLLTRLVDPHEGCSLRAQQET